MRFAPLFFLISIWGHAENCTQRARGLGSDFIGIELEGEAATPFDFYIPHDGQTLTDEEISTLQEKLQADALARTSGLHDRRYQLFSTGGVPYRNIAFALGGRHVRILGKLDRIIRAKVDLAIEEIKRRSPHFPSQGMGVDTIRLRKIHRIDPYSSEIHYAIRDTPLGGLHTDPCWQILVSIVGAVTDAPDLDLSPIKTWDTLVLSASTNHQRPERKAGGIVSVTRTQMMESTDLPTLSR